MGALVNEAVQVLKTALKEDYANQDITSQHLIPLHQSCHAILIAKQPGIWSGDILIRAIRQLYPQGIHISSKVKDKQKFKKGQTLATIKGSLRKILGLERSWLNTLQHLCGISSLTHQYVQALKPVQLLDTRKTLPGLRTLEKYAVRNGGGKNHRFHLNDMALIKENHLTQLTLDELKLKIKKIRSQKKPVVIEAQDLKQVEQFIRLPVNRILLDNFSFVQIRKARQLLQFKKSKIKLEVSGNINLKKARQLASSQIDYASVGKITHSAPACDLSLLVQIKS